MSVQKLSVPEGLHYPLGSLSLITALLSAPGGLACRAAVSTALCLCFLGGELMGSPSWTGSQGEGKEAVPWTAFLPGLLVLAEPLNCCSSQVAVSTRSYHSDSSPHVHVGLGGQAIRCHGLRLLRALLCSPGRCFLGLLGIDIGRWVILFFAC